LAARTTILVGSADDASRDGLVDLFRGADFTVAPFTSGKELAEGAAAERADLVVIDFRLEDMWGYELCHLLRQRFGESIAIVLISGDRSEPPDRVAGLLLGADECFPRPFDPSELLAQVRRLLARAPSSEDRGVLSTLTPRELDVLRLLARGLSSGKVAQELFISKRTVDTHTQRILTKLGVHSRTEAVALAYRFGLVNPEESV